LCRFYVRFQKSKTKKRNDLLILLILNPTDYRLFIAKVFL